MDPGILQRGRGAVFVPIESAAADPTVITNAAAGAGNAIEQQAAAQQHVADEHALNQARLSATSQLDELKLKYAQDPDPATAATRFGTRDPNTGELSGDAGKIYQSLAPSLRTPELQNRFADEFGGIAEASHVDVAALSLKRQNDEAVATLDDGMEQWSRQAAAATNDVERTRVVGLASNALTDAVKAGTLSAKEAQRKGQKFKEGLDSYEARAAIVANPSAALAALRKGAYPDLDPNLRIELQEHADAEIRQREREARAAFTAQKAEASAAMADIQTQLAAGLPVAPGALNAVRGVVSASRDPLLANRFDMLNAQLTVHDKLRGASQHETHALIDQLEIEGAKHPSPQLAGAILAARTFATHQDQGLQHDPLTWSASQGTVALAPLNLNGSDDAAAFKARIKAGDVTAHIYGRQPSYLTTEEVRGLSGELAHANADQKLAIATNIAKGFGDRAGAVFAQIGGKQNDPVFAHAGALAASGKINAARDALVGAELLHAKGRKDLVPGGAARASAAADLRDAFRLAPQMQNSVLATSDAIYSKRAADKGMTGGNETDDATHARAVQEAAGAAFDAGGTQYGGIVEFHGRKVAAPASIKAEDFEPILRGLSTDQLSQGSLYGGAPSFGDGTKFEDGLGSAYLVSVGDGRYAVSTTDPQGEAHLLADPKAPKGQPYILDLTKVLPWMMPKAKKP